MLILAAILSACASTAPAASTPRASGTSSPTTASDAVPLELRGVWQARLVPTGERTELTLMERGYGITRGPNAARGSAVVRGPTEIRFFMGTVCDGSGVYRWSLQGNSLQFTMVSEDCPGRAEALKDQTYQRIGS